MPIQNPRKNKRNSTSLHRLFSAIRCRSKQVITTVMVLRRPLQDTDRITKCEGRALYIAIVCTEPDLTFA